MNERRPREPILNAPDILKWLSGAFIVIHLARWLLNWLLPGRIDFLLAHLFAFSPVLYSGYPLDGIAFVPLILGPVTYMFLHGDFVHLLVNTGMLMAFGAPIARRMNGAWFFAFFVFCSVAGALFFLLLNIGSGSLLIGASGGISGVMGGFVRLGHQKRPARGGPMSERDRQLALPFAMLWLALTVFFGFFGGAMTGMSGGIAWEAHLGGFFAGLLAVNFFDGRGIGRRRRRRPDLQIIISDRE